MSLTKTPICEFGNKAKDFQLKSTSNKIITLEDVKGENGTLIMFICNHCPYVKAVIEDVVQDTRQLKTQGINSVAIMSNDIKNYPEDSFENMIEFSKKNNFNFPYLIDETQEVAKSYGAVVVKLLAVPWRGSESFVDCGGDFLVAFGINQGAKRAISKSIDRAVAIAGDDGESGGGGLEKDNTEAFFFTRKSEEIGAAIEIGECFVRDEAGEAAMTGNTKICCDFFDVFKVVAFAPEHPMKFGVFLDELGHEFEEAMVAFS